VLNPETGLLRFANAGHDLPYVKTAEGVVELRARGMPLGLMTGMVYEEKEHVLLPGDGVLLHSDGVVESHNPDRSDMYGFPRLKQAVGKFPPGRELIDSVLGELQSFTGGAAEQEDDITMVTLERSAGGSHVAVDNGRVLAEFELPSEPGNEREVMARVESAVTDIGLEPARLERLKTAVAEATMNAMEHGNEYRADRPVSIRVLHSPDRLRVQVSDSGEAVEMDEREIPDIEAKLEGRQKPRGWGLFLIEKMVDETHVSSGDGGNTLELGLVLEGGRDDDA